MSSRIALRDNIRVGFRAGIARIAGANGTAQLVALLASPVLTRLFTPEDFGLYGIFLSVVGPASVLATLRFEDAIPLPEGDEAASALVVLGCMTAIASGVAAACITYATFQLQGHRGYATHVAFIAGIAVAGSGVTASLISWAVRERAYTKIAHSALTKSVFQTTGHIALGLAGLGAVGLAGGKALEKTMGIAAVGRLYWQTGRGVLRGVGPRHLMRVASSYSQFPIYGIPAQALTSGSQFLPPLILATAYGPMSAGMFVLAIRVLVTPLMTVGGAIGQAYMGVAPDLFRSAPHRLLRLFDKVAIVLLLSGIILVGVMVIGGGALFSFVFGDQWASAASTVQLIGLAIAAKVTTGALSRTLHLVNRLPTKLGFDALAFLLGVGGLALAAALGASEHVALGVYGGVLFAHHMLYLFMLRRVIRKSADEGR